MSAAPQIVPLIKFRVEVLKGPHAGEVFAFEDKKNAFIGRGSENEICLSKDPHISRQHAEIKQLDGFFYVANLSHKNFILVNGDRVDTDRVEHNAIIKVGDSEMLLFLDTPKANLVGDATVAIHQPGSQLPALSLAQAPAPMMPPPVTTPSSPVKMKMNAPAKPASRPPASPLKQPAGPAAHYQPQKPMAAPRIQGSSHQQDGSKTRFYVIVGVVGLVLWWLLGTSKAKKAEPTFRGSVEVQGDLAESEKRIAKFNEKNEKMKDPSAMRAQENYIRGFREYRQGNYLRAMDYFQIVLSLDPGNDLADRYRKLALIKHDELVKFSMIQGRKYREKRNYRLCKSAFKNALILIQYNKQHPDYPEADRFFEECDKASQERL